MQKDYSNEEILVRSICEKDPGAYEYMRAKYYPVLRFIVRGRRARKM
jgi:hypothetical protein